MLPISSRVAARRLLLEARSSSVESIILQTSLLPRVISAINASSPRLYRLCQSRTTRLAGLGRRSYATEAALKSAKKATTKKAGGAKKGGTTKKKPKKAAPKKKKRVAVKAKPKPKKKVLTEKQKALAATVKQRSELKALKDTALTAPKRLPSTAFTVLVAELSRSASGLQGAAASARYKSLSPDELEHYNHLANQNKASNSLAYKKWVESHTPTQIYLANNARKTLKRRTAHPGQYAPIKDDRQPKRPANAYARFFQDRFSSGDYRGMTVPEAAKLLGGEWKALSSSEKQPFVDQAAKDMTRFEVESKSVLNREVLHSK
ncbi:MAG: hypothetical protein M1825_004277 [Sarcosagium campestre]|nr:MAG: hypothetical protein M1825_004277 [Sarcosagium campestre]